MSPAAAGRRAFLVRHAHAGDRSAWRGDDDRRPLSDKGWRQAEGIATQLKGQGVVRVLSSPSLRCVQTLEPLAQRLGLRVEEEPALLEGSDPDEALRVLEEAAADGPVAACSHGDIVPAVLDLLRSAGAALDGPSTWPKASTWVLEADPGGAEFSRARYLPPPG